VLNRRQGENTGNDRVGGTSWPPDGCPMGWLVEEVGSYLYDGEGQGGRAGPLAEPAHALGREAVRQGAEDVDVLLKSAFAGHEVVATELRIEGPDRGGRRTMFAEMPTPVALLLLCLRLCDRGDTVTVMHHTAAAGVARWEAVWPFGMPEAEQLTRPPACPGADDLPAF
jgi:hypothetical protein